LLARLPDAWIALMHLTNEKPTDYVAGFVLRKKITQLLRG
jgi:hypothetical protein